MKKVIIPIDKIIYKNGKLILRAYDSESQGGGSVNPSVQEELDKKVDKITTATSGNFPSFTSSGGIQDSGYNYNSFQPKLTTLTAYSDKGSATKVPKITTNSLGLVTSILEVEINIPTDNLPIENSTKPVTSGGVYKAIVDNELTVAAALNDLNSKITSTGQNLSALSILTSLDLGTISSAIELKEKVTAAALNDLNSRLLETVHTTGDETIDGTKTFGNIASEYIWVSGLFSSEATDLYGNTNVVNNATLNIVSDPSEYGANSDSQLIVGNATLQTGGWSLIYNAATGTTLQLELTARNNVQADWNLGTTTAEDYIKNKPVISSAPASGSSAIITCGGVYTALLDKEDKVAIESTAKTVSFTASIKTYYKVTGGSSAITITLPIVSDNTTLSSCMFLIDNTNGTGAITFSSSATIYQSKDWTIDAGSIYEVNALWNGTHWCLALMELEA